MTRTALHPVEQLLEQNGRTITRGGKPRHQRRHPERQAQAETLILPAVGPAADEFDALGELAKDMEYIGAVVERVDREPNGACPRCDTEGALAEVAVYLPAGMAPADIEEMCRECTPTFVVSEIASGQYRYPVVVEIPAVTA